MGRIDEDRAKYPHAVFNIPSDDAVAVIVCMMSAAISDLGDDVDWACQLKTGLNALEALGVEPGRILAAQNMLIRSMDDDGKWYLEERGK